MPNPEIYTGNTLTTVTNANPTPADSNYIQFYFWVSNTSGSEQLFILTDNTPDAAVWRPIGMNTFRSYTKTGIDGTTTGSTTIFTTESGWGDFYITNCMVAPTSISGLVSVSTVSIGTNSSSFDNLVGTTLLTGLSSVTLFQPLTILANPILIPSSTAVTINVSGAAVAAAYTFKVILTGYYI